MRTGLYHELERLCHRTLSGQFKLDYFSSYVSPPHCCKLCYGGAYQTGNIVAHLCGQEHLKKVFHEVWRVAQAAGVQWNNSCVGMRIPIPDQRDYLITRVQLTVQHDVWIHEAFAGYG